MPINLRGRLVEVQVGGSQDDIQIDAAFFIDSGACLSDDDVNELFADHGDALYDLWFSTAIERAESAAEGLER